MKATHVVRHKIKSEDIPMEIKITEDDKKIIKIMPLPSFKGDLRYMPVSLPRVKFLEGK